ncbi:arabinosyltransferase domain-containing protein [Nocardia sp. NPDC050712]|uniref:arabinosyltransferase domain-containing protein n=1 Tax=Nocardia sp. NPDC050712 TaxID=3155518 RepID=UPI0033E15A68
MRADSPGLSRVHLIAVISGGLGVLLAVLTPLLPVRQQFASLEWPQTHATQVTAPLVGYTARNLDFSVGCTTLRDLPGGTVVSTVPGAGDRGLLVRIEERAGIGRTLAVSLRGTPLLTAAIAEITGGGPVFDNSAPEGEGTPPPGPTAPPSGGAPPPEGPVGAPYPPPMGSESPGVQLPSGVDSEPESVPPPGVQRPVTAPGANSAGTQGLPGGVVAEVEKAAGTELCGALSVHSAASGTTAELSGISRSDGTPFRKTVSEDVRPQIVGLYTDLDRTQLGDARLRAELDTRFSSSPSSVKIAAMGGAVLGTLLALICLHRLDGAEERRTRRFLPVGWWRVTRLDGAVGGILLVWHVIGANTSDDGYIRVMAEAAREAGYTANYYRWFGVAEAPFGWPYEVLAWLTRISDASLWLRLPALLTGLLCWWVLSREVLPRLGSRVRSNATARWSAGLVFLTIWLPYNNGLRPEPLIALGALLTWCSMERAIATRRLLPAAIAILTAAFALAAGPSGLICLAALFAGARQVLRGIDRPVKRLGYLVLALPLLAAGTVVLVVVFADQTFASVLEAVRVRRLIGPDLAWFEEPTRWESLVSLTPDGSLARRFGILVMLLCLGVCVLVVLRKGGRVRGAARGPVYRVLAVVVMSLLLMMFTPTKWTHHLGVYAGLAAAVAAVTVVVLGAGVVRADYCRSLFGAALLFLLAFCCTGSNGWWYVSGYGVAWPNRSPQLAGAAFSTVLLALAVVLAGVAVWQYFRAPAAPKDFLVHPLAFAAAALVLFQVGTMATAAYSQYPAYSVGLSNLRGLTGNGCGLADSVLVETDTADSLMQPYVGSAANGLAAENAGFTAEGLGELAPDGPGPAGPPSAGRPQPPQEARTAAGINGSTAALPFGLDPRRTPVLGSYTNGEKRRAHLTTQWYLLDLTTAQHDPAYRAVILTVAGRFEGRQLRLEFARRAGDGTLEILGDLAPPAVGGAPMWRNLPVPLDRIPEDANAIRLVADIDTPSDKQWLAVTPPRLPHLSTLNALVGSTAPVLADFQTGFAFPCQRPFDHRDGVAELPVWRITPDKLNAQVAGTWQDETGGGPLGWTGQLTRPRTLPGYLEHDWTRDWGELQLLTPIVDAPAAAIETRSETTWGTADYGPIRTG